MHSKNFFARLNDRVAEASRNATRFTERDEASLASQADEQAVAESLNRRFAGSNWQCRANLRVPDATASRRTEIDFVITGPEQVIIVEMKSWSGRVFLDEQGWVVQEKRNGDLLRDDLFGKLAEQAEVLRLHNASQGNAAVPICHFLVFCRPNLDIDESIEARADALSFSQLVARTGMPDEPDAPGLFERILAAIMRLFGFEKESRPRPAIAAPSPGIVQFREMMSSLGSWDYVGLHGGQLIKGDILLSALGSTYDGPDALDRRSVEHLSVSVDRSLIKSMFRASDPNVRLELVRRDGVMLTDSLPTATPLLVHAAGTSSPKSYELRNVEYISFGYTHRHKFKYDFDEVKVGMLFVGKVKADGAHGLFVDLGVRDSANDARAKPVHRQAGAQASYRKGQRLLVRVNRIYRERRFVNVEIVVA